MKKIATAIFLAVMLIAGCATAQVNGGGGGFNNSSAGGGSPTGAAGGDLSGTYPNPTVAKIGGVAVGPYGTATQGQLPGVAGATAATTGNIGELVTSNVPIGSAINLTAGTPANITQVSLTAGDWDCGGTAGILPAGTTTISQIIAGVSTTTATLPTSPAAGGENIQKISFPAGQDQLLPVAPTQILIGSTTTVFLVVSTQFSVSTNQAYGFLRCRRTH